MITSIDRKKKIIIIINKQEIEKCPPTTRAYKQEQWHNAQIANHRKHRIRT